MLLDDCEKYFKTSDLYEVLNLKDKKASNAEIKKAYYKMSMKFHPDKAADDEASKTQATAIFQLIVKVYEILSDKDRRAVYDTTGAVDEENVLTEDAVNMWRRVFKKVTLEDIEKFIEEYRGTDEEKGDIKGLYERWEGDMDKIMAYALGSDADDEQRIKDIIVGMFDEGELIVTKKFKSTTSKTKTMARQRKAKKEAKEAEEEMAKIKAKEGDGDLQALILKRQAARNNSSDAFFDSLAEKYAPKKKSKK